MKLDKSSIKWAIKHLNNVGDTDLFPVPIEFSIVSELGSKAVKKISDIDLSNYDPGKNRRFIIPKNKIDYRVATQLDPLDSILLAGVTYQFGDNIENRRINIGKQKVYSNRFDPDKEGNMYDQEIGWNKFWTKCRSKASSYDYAIKLDIVDFYNQIYHHTLENQLIESHFPNQVMKYLKRLAQDTTAKVSRGIPVGPHSTHLLAEATMIPIDNTLHMKGISFCRFVDDMVVFVNSEEEAYLKIQNIAKVLDTQQKLKLQSGKTQVYEKLDFQKYCTEMINDQPINGYEEELTDIIRKYSNGNPYKAVKISNIKEEDLKKFTTDVVENILQDYLDQEPTDYSRLRWFLRRLAQVGHPAGVEFCLTNLKELTPALKELSQYFASVSANNYDWNIAGEKILEALESDIIKSNEYFILSLLSLFSKKIELNHLDKLIEKYTYLPEVAKREIIITAMSSGKGDWLRELKERVGSMSIWTKRAYFASCSELPSDERKHFLRAQDRYSKIDDLIIKWAK